MAVPGRSSVFTFESSVHPSHVLRSLEEQRQRDILCDITVVTAEGQSFRAHRSVLASCSEYFSQRISSLSGQNAVTLPLEVTAAGFEPLLKFAYTSKLLFCKENVFDIQASVSALGFKDLDGACFDFLLPKFFSSTKPCAVRKICCKKKCKGLSNDISHSDEVLLDDKEVKLVDDSSHQDEVAFQSNNSDTVKSLNIVCPATPVTPVREPAKNDTVTQCPKYRKFQMACGKEIDKGLPKPVIKYYCNSSCSSNSESGSCPLGVSRQVEDLFDSRLGNFHPGDANKNEKLCEKKQETELQNKSEPSCSVKETNKCKGEWSTSLVSPECTQENAGSAGQSWVAGNTKENTFSMAQRKCTKAEQKIIDRPEQSTQQNNMNNCNGYWTSDEAKKSNASLDWLNVQLSSSLQDLEQSTSGWQCPKSSEYEGTSQSGLSSVNSGEDSDTEEPEVYCEAYAQERARQVQLPFPVDQIVAMSRNDFQELLDKQNLTQEQLEVVRDMRRRSKNRLAAKRCRKRKLDCIYNLQCEINKLKTEREMLMQERTRLSQLRLKTYHSVSTLCQRVCANTNLPPEQLQQLAKYTAVECPLASYMPFIDSLLSSQHLQSTQLFPTGGEDDNLCSNTVTTQEPKHNANNPV